MEVTKQLAGNCWCDWFPLLQVCKYPGTGEGTSGKPRAATWPWFVLMDEVLGQGPNCLHPWGHTRPKCHCGWPGGGDGGWGWGGGGGGRGRGRESARAVQKAEEGGRTRLPHQGGHEAVERGRGEAGAGECGPHGEVVLSAGENGRPLSFLFFLYCYIILSFILIYECYLF